MRLLPYVAPGALVAGIGFAIFFGLLAALGALAKSKQFSAIGDLVSGRAGAAKRRLFLLAMAMCFVGSCGCFVGVGIHDSKRRQACVAKCEGRGYPGGVIGPSRATKAGQPNVASFVACTCTAEGELPPLEWRADDLVF